MQRRFSGEFVIAEPVPGTWLIGNLRVPKQTIIVRGVQTPRAAVPDLPTDLSLSWAPDGTVVLNLADAGRSVAVSCATASSQEPDETLYRVLPLAQFTADRQRFWRRVFRLVRIPGGRFLLGLIARRRGGAGPRD
jgi:hypothetical protein